MADATADFFEALGSRGRDPRIQKVKGTLRFDLTDGSRTTRWLLSFDRGELGVSHRSTKADCVVRMDKALFDSMARGEMNPFAAVLRGAVEVRGNPELLVLFRRLATAPPTPA
ncbi:MAG TPA: SCP2 sterol-binding domain-containing protein [Gaiellaceae bacterium]|nr:SCP2 sterol-binding domain-containing protein [Gaiellaceae bacterium]